MSEARLIPKKYDNRFSVLPGITSPWVVQGSHQLSFKKWMKLDLEYVKEKSLLADMKIAVQTAGIIFKTLFR